MIFVSTLAVCSVRGGGVRSLMVLIGVLMLSFTRPHSDFLPARQNDRPSVLCRMICELFIHQLHPMKSPKGQDGQYSGAC